VFQCRVAVLAIDGDRLLVHQLPGEPYWSLPGGRLEIGETFAQAAVREMREETGLEVEAVSVRWLVENFFDGTLPGITGARFHEVGAYVQVTVPPELSARDEFTGFEDAGDLHHELHFRWFPFADLDGLDLRPSVLRGLLARLDEPHVITTNDER